jgi:hypothetical protein
VAQAVGPEFKPQYYKKRKGSGGGEKWQLLYTIGKNVICIDIIENSMAVPQKIKNSQVPVAHKYNPNYPGVRDQEDGSSRPAGEMCSRDPISKIPNTQKNKGWKRGSRCRAPN